MKIQQVQTDMLPYKIVDIHTHFFPEKLFESIWKFFESNSWRINYKGTLDELVDGLTGFGVEKFTVLNYLHRTGIRDSLAEWTKEFTDRHEAAIPFGTVYPGEDGNVQAARKWFSEWGFAGLKIQPLVSQKPVGGPEMYPVFEVMCEYDKWLLIHAGTAPYPNEYTGLANLEQIMEDIPELNVILAHMGGYEFEKALYMMEKHPNMYLDTTMIFVETDVFDSKYPLPVEKLLPFQDRLLFGSDYPNIPYEYSESINSILRTGLPENVIKKIFRENALELTKNW